ncbi:MAG: ribonuclease III [Acidimicrobiia bacterium]
MTLDRLAEEIGHAFQDVSLLERALVHRSYTAEHPALSDNERMEFLGDAVLQLVVTDFLYEHFPTQREGELAKIRAACVNRDELAVVARRIGVGEHIRLGIGERQSGGSEKSSILGDAMEALLAAVYLDAGLEAARGVVLSHWSAVILSKATAPGRLDFKTRLQEELAADGRRPLYTVDGSGPDHAREFVAIVEVDGVVWGRGSGRSKKEAEQDAARAAMLRL